jgi:hypothetical protein
VRIPNGRRPPPPAALIGMVVLLGVGLFIAFGLRTGGFGMAHFLGALIVAVAGGLFAIMGGRR